MPKNSGKTSKTTSSQTKATPYFTSTKKKMMKGGKVSKPGMKKGGKAC